MNARCLALLRLGTFLQFTRRSEKTNSNMYELEDPTAEMFGSVQTMLAVPILLPAIIGLCLADQQRADIKVHTDGVDVWCAQVRDACLRWARNGRRAAQRRSTALSRRALHRGEGTADQRRWARVIRPGFRRAGGRRAGQAAGLHAGADCQGDPRARPCGRAL